MLFLACHRRADCGFPGGRYSADSRVVHFVKAKSVGLRLAGGNDVGIFVSSVREGSPADSQGVREGDPILQVPGAGNGSECFCAQTGPILLGSGTRPGLGFLLLGIVLGQCWCPRPVPIGLCGHCPKGRSRLRHQANTQRGQAPPQLAQRPSPGLLGVVAGTWVTGTSYLSHPALGTAVPGTPTGTCTLRPAGGAMSKCFSVAGERHQFPEPDP